MTIFSPLPARSWAFSAPAAILHAIRAAHPARLLDRNPCARPIFHAAGRMGLTTLLALQVLLNVAVVTNLLPATGISLPFFSSGGTALIMQLAECGIVLNISRSISQTTQISQRSGEPMRVIFTCGGTGGHINPALAVAKILRERRPDSEILFVGAEDGMETKLVPARELPASRRCTISNYLRSITPAALSGTTPRRSLCIRRALKKADRIIREFPAGRHPRHGRLCQLSDAPRWA